MILDISRGQHNNDTQQDHEYATRPILALHISPPRFVASNGSHFTKFSIYSHTPISITTLTILTQSPFLRNKPFPFPSVFVCFSNPPFSGIPNLNHASPNRCCFVTLPLQPQRRTFAFGSRSGKQSEPVGGSRRQRIHEPPRPNRRDF